MIYETPPAVMILVLLIEPVGVDGLELSESCIASLR